MKLRLGQVAKQLPRIANAVDKIGNHQSIVSPDGRGRCEHTSSVEFNPDSSDEQILAVLRPFFYHLFKNSDGVVYVITGTNENKLEEELKRFDKYVLRNDETRNMLVMILANEQQGLEGALSHEEIVDKVREELSEYDPMLGGRILFVRGCNSQTKVGLEEAFSHFAQIMQQRRGGHITPGFHNFSEDELCAHGKK